MSEGADAVEAAEEADPADAEHDQATETDQPDADALPEPDGLPEPDTDSGDTDASDGAVSDPVDSTGDGSDQADADEQDQASTTSATEDTMGDLYAQMLTNLTNAFIEEHGRPDAEKVDVEAARQADLDHHFDRLMDDMGLGRDLPPGQAVVLSTTMFLGGNLAAKTDAPQQVLGDLDLEF